MHTCRGRVFLVNESVDVVGAGLPLVNGLFGGSKRPAAESGRKAAVDARADVCFSQGTLLKQAIIPYLGYHRLLINLFVFFTKLGVEIDSTDFVRVHFLSFKKIIFKLKISNKAILYLICMSIEMMNVL